MQLTHVQPFLTRYTHLKEDQFGCVVTDDQSALKLSGCKPEWMVWRRIQLKFRMHPAARRGHQHAVKRSDLTENKCLETGHSEREPRRRYRVVEISTEGRGADETNSADDGKSDDWARHPADSI